MNKYIKKLIRERKIKASFTVEASIVTSIVLIVFVFMIRFSYQLRDSVFGNIELNEAVELYSHKSEDSDTDIEAYENERLKNILLGGEYTVAIEEKGDGCKGILYGDAKSKTITDRGFCPQKLMRKTALAEAIKEKGTE